jgi:hypothetical protein
VGPRESEFSFEGGLRLSDSTWEYICAMNVAECVEGHDHEMSTMRDVCDFSCSLLVFLRTRVDNKNKSVIRLLTIEGF